jgi:predicted metal-binding membrane protein
MLVLFVVGAMSLPWMGAISIAIFAEKVGKKPLLVARGIGVLFLVVGGLFALRALAAG